jgi:putative ABC transport system permease protein
MNILRELMFARRTLAKHPLVTLAAVITLALGIGANTTTFSLVKAVFVDPFVFHDQDRSVIVFSENVAQHSIKQRVSVADFRDLRERNRAFDKMAFVVPAGMALTGLKEPARITAARVSEDFFSFFDFKPFLGRPFLAVEFRAGANHSAVLSHGFWQSRLGADPAVVGKMIHLDGEAYTVVGIMPPNFWMPSRRCSLWLPMAPSVAAENRTERAGLALAHLAPGVTLEKANQDLDAVSRQLAAEYPLADAGWNARAYASLQAVMGPNDPALVVVLFGVVGALLLVACSNVANLMLAQAAARRREMAIRMAIGASRWHLMRQSLAESLLLAGMAGALGLLVGFWAKDLFVSIYPSEILLSDRLADPAVLAFCMVTSMLSALIFGLAPALDSSRHDPIEALKETRGSGARTHRLASMFVTSQIALSMVLLLVTGVLLESVRHLRRLDLGFNPARLVVASVEPSLLRHAGDEKLRAFYDQAIQRLTATPSVHAASATSALPVFSDGAAVHIGMPGEQALPAERSIAMRVTIAPRYFEVAGIPLRRGREFGAADKENAPRVAVVNQAMADLFWKGAGPLGKQVRTGDSGAGGALWTIVGVAANLRSTNLQAPAGPQIYLPLAQAPQREMYLLVKSDADPHDVVGGVRRAIAGVDPDEPVEPKIMSQMLADEIRGSAIIGNMLVVFATLAVLMASVGLFALVAYSVNERMREIGIRIALGATQSGVMSLVLRRGLRLALVGIGVGLMAGAALTRSLGGLLIEVSPWDPRTFIGVSLVLIAISALASYLPARRAMRIDPITALRQD